MLDIGFAPQIRQVLSSAPKERQTMLFSATMPAEIAGIASHHMKMPLRIEVAPAGTSAANVEQEIHIVTKEGKLALLDKMLKETTGVTLVFSRTKFGAMKISDNLRALGHKATDMHSSLSLARRRAALDGFKMGRYRILVATDIASRGIDVKNIALVVNYDLPDNCEDYVHRIGRTGRAGSSGKAVSFATHAERSDIKQIERLIKKTIPIITSSGQPLVAPKSNVEFTRDTRDTREARPKRFNSFGASRGGDRRTSGGGNRGGFAPRREEKSHSYRDFKRRDNTPVK